MSNFASTMEALMAMNKLTLVDIASTSGFSASQLSKWRRGIQTSLGAEDFRRLADSICKNPRERAELLMAHLRDECFDTSGKLIRLSYAGDQRTSKEAVTDFDRAIAYLQRQGGQSDALRDAVITYAKSLEEFAVVYSKAMAELKKRGSKPVTYWKTGRNKSAKK